MKLPILSETSLLAAGDPSLEPAEEFVRSFLKAIPKVCNRFFSPMRIPEVGANARTIVARHPIPLNRPRALGLKMKSACRGSRFVRDTASWLFNHPGVRRPAAQPKGPGASIYLSYWRHTSSWWIASSVARNASSR